MTPFDAGIVSLAALVAFVLVKLFVPVAPIACSFAGVGRSGARPNSPPA